ncbi:MAG: thioredoxin domain-containing protein [Sphingobium sp.]
MRLIAAFLLALFAAIPAVAQAPANWTRTVTLAPGGAYVLGNPRASRLIEYVSYTCPHCAAFMAEASGPLRSNWVRRGLISIEVRNAIRDRYDLTAAVLARCGGKARFFDDHEALFANHAAWMTKVQAYDAGNPAPAGDEAAVLEGIATGTGLSDLMVKRGLPVAQQRACFADKATLTLLSAMARDAWDVKKIGGTPSFSVAGKAIPDAHDWATLRPALPVLAK